jgi:DNA-binding transcriptional LysR family regulator
MGSLDQVPSFTLRQLAAFVAVAETGTISAAAQRLLVSHSAVSLSLTELERALGTRLCVRHRARGVRLTPTGEAMLPRAVLLLRRANEMEQDAAGPGGDLSGPLSVGCFPTVGPTVLPSLLRAFGDAHPGVDIRFAEATADTLTAKLLRGELDTAIMYDLELPPEFASATLLVRRPAVAVAADHWLAHAQGPVVLHDLAAEPMVLLDTTPSAAHAIGLCAQAGFTPRIGYRSANFETVRSFVGRGLGWTIMLQRPAITATYEGLDVVAREIDEPVLAPVGLLIVWRRDILLSRVARAFIEFAVAGAVAAAGAVNG